MPRLRVLPAHLTDTTPYAPTYPRPYPFQVRLQLTKPTAPSRGPLRTAIHVVHTEGGCEKGTPQPRHPGWIEKDADGRFLH